MGIKLNFVKTLGICHGPEGLTEPSGLCLARDGKALWTVSDDTRTVFKLDLEGRLIEGESFTVGKVGFEGITLDETSDFLYVAQEGGNVLVKYSLQKKSSVLSKRLSELDGYQRVKGYFSKGDKNKGLEGISIDSETGNLVLLKEGGPGLFLEVSPDLEKLVEYRKLTKKRGFRDNNVKSKDIDYSGISYDPTRKAFWIVSDKAKRIYLYSRERDKVLFNRALKYMESGKKKTRSIKKAEGVAYDAEINRLYIVSDEEARLFVYDVR